MDDQQVLGCQGVLEQQDIKPQEFSPWRLEGEHQKNVLWQGGFPSGKCHRILTYHE